jgi:hypothetical protein
MKRSFEEIIRLVLDMQREQSPVLTRMRGILDRYDGDWVLPIPEVPNEPNMPPLTPALIGEAVDHMAMRAASVQPMVTCPAMNPMKDTGVRSREYGTIRRKILAATYDDSKWKLGRRRFYRQLSAYHTGSLCVVPDFRTMMPRIEVRDPLGTFVEPQANEELRAPMFCAFINRYSGEWLRARFPAVRGENGGPVTGREVESLWDIVEWYDEDQILWGLVGPVEQWGQHVSPQWQQAPWMQLSPAYPNRAGMIPAVVPHNVSLGKIAARLGSLIGNVDLQAKLMALNIIAQEKAIFPDVYAIGRQNMQPQIIGNEWKDGREGKINLLVDVESVGVLRTTPDQGTMQMSDRLERNFRASSGLVPQFGGETYGALRTGRGIDALAGMAVDPRIQELHEISEAWLPHLNAAILATYKGYWPDKKYSMYSGWAGDVGRVEFTPSQHIECYDNTVSYVVAGADITQQTQILGSLYGAKAISAKTFRMKHPWIDDADAESRMVDEEALEDAMKQMIMQQLVAGQLDPMVAVTVRNEMQKGHDIFAAMQTANEEMQARQAAMAPPAPEGMGAAPEAMPGMMAPEASMAMQGGAPMGGEPVQAPGDQVAVPQGSAAMRQLMQVMGG